MADTTNASASARPQIVFFFMVFYGTTQILYSSADVIVYSRQFFSKQVVVAINRHPTQAYTIPSLVTSLPNGTYSDVLNGLLYGEGITVNNGTIPSFTLTGVKFAYGRTIL